MNGIKFTILNINYKDFLRLFSLCKKCRFCTIYSRDRRRNFLGLECRQSITQLLNF